MVVSQVCCIARNPVFRSRLTDRPRCFSSKALSSVAASDAAKTNGHAIAEALYNHDDICEHDAVVVVEHSGVSPYACHTAVCIYIHAHHMRYPASLASRIRFAFPLSIMPYGEGSVWITLYPETRIR